MRHVRIEGLDLAPLPSLVGRITYDRGVSYARGGHVLRMDWDGVEQAVEAVVRGSGREPYETVVFFDASHDDRARYAYGECSCPVGQDCKHAVAVAVVAAATAGGRAVVEQQRPVSWEQSLGTLLAPAGPPPGDPAALALELTIAVTPPAIARYTGATRPQLQARLVRPGRSGWVAGDLSWSRLDSTYVLGDAPVTHVRLLRELYALHRAQIGPAGHYYGSQERSIDLSGFGPRLWALLDEAAEIGLQIVHARRRHGAVDPYAPAELVLDVTAGAEPESLAITPALHVDGVRDVVPALFLGAEGHGLVFVPRSETARAPSPTEWRFGLARLAVPASAALQRMVQDGQVLAVPAAEQARFAAEFYPRLRHRATVVSSDAAFVPPAITGPELVLRADYGAGHDLTLRWEWAYEVGGSAVRAGVDQPAEGFRDLAGERALAAALDVPLERFGLRRDGRELAAGVRLAGMDTMRFTTQLLPLLSDAAGVTVEVTGEPAEYREAGDTLRIGVSTAARDGDADWFDLGVTISLEGRDVPFASVFTALATDEPHLLLPDGAYFSLQKPELAALRALIEEARALQDRADGSLRISRFQVGLWEELAALGVVDSQARAWREQVSGLLALDGLGTTDVPATLAARLRPYQREGFDWLAFLHRHGLGGILADDMGLGKTLQALALVCHAKQTDQGMAPFLVVAPTSVVANWAAEAARFAPGLAVVPVTDTLRRRDQQLPEVIAGADVVVTSYAIFRLDIEAYAAARWSGLVLDEAQFVKNHQSKAYQCARRLPAPFKLAITGTPMENNLMELWSLLSITAPGLFPRPERFKEHFARPIERRADPELLARLRRRIRPLMKRRTKEQVATDLPEKQEQLLEVELDARHRRIYQRHLQRERQKVLGLLGDLDRNRFTILRSLTVLRLLSLHPGLVDPEHLGLGCAKIEALCEQLDEVVRGGHRALVFSQFTGFLGQVRERLDAAGVAYCYLDGTTRRRAEVVERFRRGDAPVFLISLKAGGFGLNLTEADYCFLLDPWWNPATEAQAIDRTHRIGQTRRVMVYRMIAKDTIEEKVLALARRKAELFAGVMDEGGVFGTALGAADIRELLG